MSEGPLKAFLTLTGLSVLSALCLGAAAARADDISTNLGFHRLDSSTPTQLSLVADSVFEVRMPGGDSKGAVSILDLTSPTLQNIGARIDRDPDLDALGKIVAKKQIENCRRERIETHCPVSHLMVKATAFIAGGDGSVLFTNAHVVDDYYKLLKVLSPEMNTEATLTSSNSLPIFLFDRNGQLVFDPYVDGAKIKTIGAPSSLSKARGTWFAEDSDYVVIKLGKSIGHPIAIGKRASVEQSVWHVGFPACTGCTRNANINDPALNRSRKEFGDSTGVGFYWSPAGEIVSTNVAQSHVDHFEQFQALANWDKMIFFSGDSQVGMSGGPILNDQAQVVGIYAGSKPLINGKGKMNVLSRGVRPTEFDLVH